MIKPVTINTNNVAKEISNIAIQNSVKPDSLYIQVSSIETFIKNNDSDLIEIHYEDFEKYTDEATLRDSSVVFEQKYEIYISSKYNGFPFEHMKSEIEFEENDTIVNLIIKKGSILKYEDDLYENFLNYIVELQLRSNVMIQLFDVDYQNYIKSFVDVLKKIKTITFKEDKKIPLSKGLKEEESIQADISMTIEASKKVYDENDKVDHSDRGFLLSCIEGEELFEFSKPKQGKNGRNCLGEIIEVEIVDLDAKPEFSINDNIQIVDSFENIKYLATKSGYLLQNEDHYDVSNSIDVDEISFKTTGTIDTDLDTEISINIVKKNPLEDAIEKGMRVKVQNLTIDGSIGPNTEIEARNVSISGQTHAESFIKCVKATLGVHKGKINARTVEVDTLQGGEIIADSVTVKSAINGKITAKTIDITVLGSHLVLEASEYIQIKRVRGDENKFILNPLANSGLEKDNPNEEEYFKTLTQEFDLLAEKFKNISITVKKNLEPCKKVKEAILKSKEEGTELSSILIDKFKLCRVMNVRYKKSREDVAFKKDQLDKLKSKLSSSTHNIMDSKLTLGEPLKGFNHITYMLSKPDRKIELNIDESMNKKIFKIIEDDDGILSIVNL